MRIVLKVMRNHHNQRVPSVMIQADTQKYFFNIPETTQRFVKDNGVKFNSNVRIFFSGLSPHHLTGMVGLALTLFEHNLSNQAQIFGPEGTTQFFKNLQFLFGIKMYTYSIADMDDQELAKFLLACKDQPTLLSLLENPQALEILNNWDDISKNKFPAQSLNNATKSLQKAIELNLSQILSEYKVYKDENMACILIKISEQDARPDLISEASMQLEKKESVEKPGEMESEKIVLGDNASSKDEFCYAIIFNKTKGGMVKEKIQEFGLKGAQIGALRKNGSLLLQNGQKVTLDMITEPDEAGPAFLIVDVKNKEHLRSLKNNQAIKDLFDPNLNPKIGIEYNLDSIVHAGDIDLIATPEYLEFIQSFGPHVNHQFFNETLDALDHYPESNFNSFFRHQEYTNSLHKYFPNTFPYIENLQDTVRRGHNAETLKAIKTFLSDQCHLNPYRKGAEWIARPIRARGQTYWDEDKVKVAAEVDKFYNFDEVFQANRDLVEQLGKGQSRGSQFIFADKPKLEFFGTGSMMPSTYRNVSAIGLSFDANSQRSHILMDCGEGTYSQIIDTYGLQGIDSYLENLRVIFISHIHTDHNLGMFKILAERKLLQKKLNRKFEPIFLLMPKNCLSLILNYETYFEDLDVRLISVQDLKSLKNTGEIEALDVDEQKNLLLEDERNLPNDDLKILFDYYNPIYMTVVQKYSEKIHENVKDYQKYLEISGLEEILPVKVDHCPQSHGVVIKSVQGWIVTYSGDCRPSAQLIEQGKGSTVLVHEATFQSNMKQQAIDKNHTTIEEAVKVAIKMEAERLILTHFSQRYTITEQKNINQEKIVFQEKEKIQKYLNEKGVVAFDLMSVDLADLDILPTLSPLLNHAVCQEK